MNKEKLIKELNRLGGWQEMANEYSKYKYKEIIKLGLTPSEPKEVYGHNRQYWHWRATTWGIEPYKELVEYDYVRPPIKMKKIVRKFRFKLDK